MSITGRICALIAVCVSKVTLVVPLKVYVSLYKLANAPTQPVFDTEPETQAPSSDSFYRDASEYYGTSRGAHPRSDQKMPLISHDQMLMFDSFNFQYIINPRSLMMAIGEKAQILLLQRRSTSNC